ncbi:hypothetical protein phytr_5290 [Candidatus Phycorickettsia trachydisci]|uniref:Protein-L-isoaspartate O-methyltransferase n=1 Tax=Candidatus Phycorickettsia trachydisci TaxID=2115978 RepID=A0A2P1P8A1_9RICK|nr:protein-L-isoaspartate(D-aspartate) O-methyltransferase [Candidatus Phycorickettsia trachydisci]AVP87475.1 hypothetical protein phytr_5290 [Candidatus Phycorickettsia trachydisci]
MYEILRASMVKLLKDYGISDPLVLGAMHKILRHLFVLEEYKSRAYEDSALPISCGQTISQPYIVALMTEKADLNENLKILEIGTGSGYQAAILGEICKEVYSLEAIEQLANSAKTLLNKLGYKNVYVKYDDSLLGWMTKSPFDRIIVTAAANEVPQILFKQLSVGGHILIPLEVQYGKQILVKLTKTLEKYRIEKICDVAFVPLV